jgi:hypothetical protein
MANDPRLRDGGGKLSEVDDVVKWVQAGFSRYAIMCRRQGQKKVASIKAVYRDLELPYRQVQKYLYQGEVHNKVSIQIEHYGDRFSRVLRDELTVPLEGDSQQLRLDLSSLKKSGCSALNLAELMLACTSDQGVTFPYLLCHATTLGNYIRNPNAPGGRKWTPRPTRSKLAPPLSIQYLLDVAPQPTSVKFYVAYFYRFLKSFGYDHDTLRSLLKTMQYVRICAPPVADYLHTKPRYEFSSSSLPKMVNRYFRDDPGADEVMSQTVVIYKSSADVGHKMVLEPASYMPPQDVDATVDWIVQLVSTPPLLSKLAGDLARRC